MEGLGGTWEGLKETATRYYVWRDGGTKTLDVSCDVRVRWEKDSNHASLNACVENLRKNK